jgi:transcriptional regulator with XRE-family HTH domain
MADDGAVATERDEWADNDSERAWSRDWGRLLRLARQVAGLSLSELSAATSLSKGYLSKLESGHPSGRNPSRATLAALARALPSFRPLAHTLEPAASLPALALGDVTASVPPFIHEPDGALGESPVQLGWRELELLIALLALCGAALPQPTNAVILTRATGRGAAETSQTINRLVRMGILEQRAAARPGFPPDYHPSAQFEALTGLRRVGDALVLAASLLGQAPTLRRRDSDGDERG